MTTRKTPPIVPPEPAPPAPAPSTISPRVVLTLPSAAESTTCVATIENFRTEVEHSETAIGPYVHPILPGDEKRYNGIAGARWNVVPMIAELLRKHPDLESGLAPEDILGGRDAADAMELAADDMTLRATALHETKRVDRSIVWNTCSEVLNTARGKARLDKPLAADLVKIENELAIGKRVDQANRAAAAAEAKVTKSAQRLAKAQQKAA